MADRPHRAAGQGEGGHQGQGRAEHDEQLCPSCSLLIDGLPHLSHLRARNTTLTVVARGPLDKLRGYWERMGWTVPVVSSAGSDFNWDFNVTVDPSVRAAEYNFAPMVGDWAGELPGTSVFLRDGDTVFHSYSSYARGGDVQIGVFWVASESDKQAMVQDPGSPFFTTPHFDGHRSVLLRSSRIGELTRQELAEVVQDAWLAQASERKGAAWLAAHAVL